MKKKNSGAASLLIIFLLSMIGVLIGVSLVESGSGEAIMGKSIKDSAKAYYAANSGIEDAILRITEYQVADGVYPTEFIDGTATKYQFTINTLNENKKSVESVGTYTINTKKYIRKIKIELSNSWGFDYAIHAYTGGYELRNNSQIFGDVYSNGSIILDSNASNAVITGNVWAVDNIEGGGGGGNGVVITGDAHANHLKKCDIGGIPYSPFDIEPKCKSDNSWVLESQPEEKRLPDLKIGDLQNIILSTGGSEFGTPTEPENCTIGGSNDCSINYEGKRGIGNIIVYGKLTFDTDTIITGPIYVVDVGIVEGEQSGMISFNKNGVDINLDPLIINNPNGKSQIIAAENIIDLPMKVNTFAGNGKFLLFVSTFVPTPTPSELCDFPSVIIDNNNNDVSGALFYATRGCVTVTNNGAYSGASIVGYRIRTPNNFTLYYDTRLKDIVIDSTSTNNWKTNLFKEY